MAIIKYNYFKVNEKGRTELFGVDRRPSNIISRQDQDFYDYYTHKKFRGMSKYELNSEIFKLAQRKDEIGIIAQFCLQVERESIAADDFIVNKVEDIEKNIDGVEGNINNVESDVDTIESDIDEIEKGDGIELDDISTNDISQVKESRIKTWENFGK